LASILGNQGVILLERGDLDGAMALYQEQERLCRQLGNLNGVQVSLGNQALILEKRGELDRAMALLGERERLARQLGDLNSLQVCLGNQVSIVQKRGDLDGAIALLHEQERICRQVGNPADLQRCLRNRAIVWAYKNDYASAITDFTEVIRVEPRDARAYNGMAWILATCPVEQHRDGTKAVELATKACELSKWRIPNHLDTLAAACAEAGDFDQAIRWEMKALESPDVRGPSGKKMRQRLRLYQEHKPYHGA
jgi:tetratricopeptide (TPR) repeat protein